MLHGTGGGSPKQQVLDNQIEGHVLCYSDSGALKKGKRRRSRLISKDSDSTDVRSRSSSKYRGKRKRIHSNEDILKSNPIPITQLFGGMSKMEESLDAR